jgi:two-component system cell cycle response regulator
VPNESPPLTPAIVPLYDFPHVDDWDEDTTAAESGRFAAIDGQRPCLTILTGSSVGQTFHVTKGNALIGRAQEAQLRIIDDGVSRQHARIKFDTGGNLYVCDLASRNGTYVNGKRIAEPTRLQAGDKVQIGRTTVLRFEYQDALDQSYHEQLLSSALRDGLTRLFNKRYFLERLDAELKFARRHETGVSLLILDLDHFKKINDDHGHLAGDAVLAHLAQLLVRAVRNEDVVARFGGEELAVILRAIPVEPATALAERLRRLVEHAPLNYNEKQLPVTVSIGVAGYPSTNAESVDALVDAADQALYRAKHAGRNRVSR